MTDKLSSLFGMKDLRNCPVIAISVVMATRLSVLYAHAGRDALPDLAVRLHSMRAAQAVETLVATINTVWPEPFTTRRPCCMVLSPDEALLVELVTAAAQGNRAQAMDAMHDFLPTAKRDRLFHETIELVDAICTARTQQAER